MRKQYVFGPVASRRLGRSLGVDMVPAKTCTIDCIYCEAGKTDKLTCQRKEYVPLAAVQAELQEVLASSPELDYITFSGAGEPTLNSQWGELACWLKQNYPQYRICLLTNGTLLNDPQVRKNLQYVDLAVPNFDAGNAEELAVINRPAPGITVESIAEGIRLAAAEYPGKLVLELFIVPGVNDSDKSIAAFAEYIKSFAGLRMVQLNTLDRPGVVDWIKPADAATIKRFIEGLQDIVPVESVGRYRCRSSAWQSDIKPDDMDNILLDMVKHRAVSAADIAAALKISLEEAGKRAEQLVSSGLLAAEKNGKDIFYSPGVN